MSTVQALNFKQQLSEAQSIAAQRKAALTDATSDTIFKFRRELRAVAVDGIGTYYVYEPISVTERDAYQKHLRFDPVARLLTSSMRGIAEGIAARVRDKNGTLLYSDSDLPRLLSASAETLTDIWHAIGGDTSKPLSDEMVDSAEKK